MGEADQRQAGVRALLFRVRDWMFRKRSAHVHDNLRKFPERVDAYRAASADERLRARAALLSRTKAANSGIPTTVLGAGVAAIAAFGGLLGTYTIFLSQSVVNASQDAQDRAVALADTGKIKAAATALHPVLREVSSTLHSSTQIVLTVGLLILLAIAIAWVIASDRARRSGIASAWLYAYKQVEAAETPPARLRRIPRPKQRR